MSTILIHCDNCKGTGKEIHYLHYAGFEYLYYESCKMCNEVK